MRWTLLGWLVFVIYGSLVPLDFRPMPLAQAWTLLKAAPFLNIGAGGRADWIANGVLFLPIGLLSTVLLRGARACGTWRALAAGLLALAFGGALAVGIEFTQLFFSGRTVSLNDILSECVGTLLGMLLAPQIETRLSALRALLREWAPNGANMALQAYALAYLFYSLFPYDLILSVPELQQKLGGQGLDWLLAPAVREQRGLVIVSKLLVELLMAMPLGLLLARHSAGRWLSLRGLLLPVLAASAGIELLQLLLVSGISQGASVLVRALGVMLGLRHAAGAVALINDLERQRPALARWSNRLALPYLLTLILLEGWFSGPVLDWTSAWARLVYEIRFMPFYYHYYTTEARALFSLASVGLLFAPLGLWAWAHWLSWRRAAVLTGLLAAVVELGKLFFVPARPDPTNVWIAMAAAALAHGLAQTLARQRLAPAQRAGLRR